MKISALSLSIGLLLSAAPALADREPAASLEAPVRTEQGGEGPSAEIRAGRISGLASSVFSLSLGVVETADVELGLPSYVTEFHDGGDPAWKLELITLSSKSRDGLYIQWATAAGLTNDCPLCQTDLEQVYLNALAGPAYSAGWGSGFALVGFETSNWTEDGRQSLGIPTALIGLETELGPLTISLSTSYSEARMKVKRESELRFELEAGDGVSFVTQGSYRTISSEDDESKAFFGVRFSK